MSDDFRHFIEELKLRTAIEEIVRERVPELRQQGRLWVACCPFHEERTPSFKVDPQRGTWRCFGACSDGGDLIRFVERFDRLEFLEAVEMLAARAGIELPRRNPAGGAKRERLAPLYALLERTQAYYASELRGAHGAAARAYWQERGIGVPTLEAFGVGLAAREGDALVRRARAAGTSFDDLETVGLARRSERGRVYDFFRERLMIPIRDIRGRPVGFGGRRLSDTAPPGAEPPPKYVNTPETPLFHKGRLIYALDRALAAVRRERHLILMEGYTDVMAAHQVGLGQVAAVLGTALTDEHAALVRRSGARRVTLVFDGDDAGRQATRRALHGLLPLELEIDVVAPPEGEDPCDLFVREGDGPFRAELARANNWLDFLLAGLDGLSGARLSAALDELLGLVGRIARPLHREERIARIAAHTGYPIESVREQFETLPERLAAAHAAEARARSSSQAARAQHQPTARRGAQPSAGTIPSPPPGAPRSAPANGSVRRAWGELCGALICDPSLVPVARPLVADCSDEELRTLLEAICAIADRPDGVVDESSLLTELGDHSVRQRLGRIAAHAARAESPQALFDGACQFLNTQRERARITREKSALSTADESQIELLRDLHQRLRHLKSPRSPEQTPGSDGAVHTR